MIPHLVHLPSSQFAKTSQWTCEPVDLVVSDSVWFLFDLGWGWCIYIQSKWFSWEMMDWHFTTLRFSHEHPWTNSKGYGRKNGIPAFLSQCGIIIIIWIKIPGSQTCRSHFILYRHFFSSFSHHYPISKVSKTLQLIIFWLIILIRSLFSSYKQTLCNKVQYLYAQYLILSYNYDAILLRWHHVNVSEIVKGCKWNEIGRVVR